MKLKELMMCYEEQCKYEIPNWFNGKLMIIKRLIDYSIIIKIFCEEESE